MRIRTLVLALACLAAAPLAIAADSAPAIKIDGFVDTIYGVTNYEHGSAETGFTYAGKLGVSATISDKVSAQIDLNHGGSSIGSQTVQTPVYQDNNNNGQFDPGEENVAHGLHFVDSREPTGSEAVVVRQCYGVWKIADAVELKTGKFISDVGWTAAYSPGLYRVNGGVITRFYGVDQVGANLKYTMGDITAALTVANGFFGEGESSSSQGEGQNNEDYSVGLDLVYSLGDAGSVNLELIEDAGAGTGGTAGEQGAAYHGAVNVTLTPTKDLTVGAEYIRQTINNKSGAEDTENTGMMVLVNYKLSTATPMSVTAQASQADVDGGPSSTTNEFALALLTNPAGTDKLGANLEVNYTSVDTNGVDTEGAVGAAAELLYVF